MFIFDILFSTQPPISLIKHHSMPPSVVKYYRFSGKWSDSVWQPMVTYDGVWLKNSEAALKAKKTSFIYKNV